jgi:hypothetical protein
MTDQARDTTSAEADEKARKPWIRPELEVIPAEETETSAIGPATDGLTGTS